MAISPKGKRKITVEGVALLWWVRADDEPPFVESSGESLHVAEADGGWLVSLPLGQREPTRHLVVKKGVVRGEVASGVHRRFRCPDFGLGPAESRIVVRPSSVAELIEWCTSTASAPIEVNYLGQPIEGDA